MQQMNLATSIARFIFFERIFADNLSLLRGFKIRIRYENNQRGEGIGTSACCNHRYDALFWNRLLKTGQAIQLFKNPDNPYDQEAIRAEIPPIGKIGYVANSAHTVPKGCRSAGA
ncbi:hypothetical protein BSK67_28245 [Paenibacillus odorifer]|nr:hypothetical protein BSK67_28245 [Paenibacillus odorifer]